MCQWVKQGILYLIIPFTLTPQVCEESDLLASPGFDAAAIRQLMTHHQLPSSPRRQTILLAGSSSPPRLLQAAADDWLSQNHVIISGSWPEAAADVSASSAAAPSVGDDARDDDQQQQQLHNAAAAAAGDGGGIDEQQQQQQRWRLMTISDLPRTAAEVAAPAVRSVSPVIRHRVLGLAPLQKGRVLLQLLSGGHLGVGAQGLGVGGLSLVFVDDQETATQIHR
jgi:hypothetical protein